LGAAIADHSVRTLPGAGRQAGRQAAARQAASQQAPHRARGLRTALLAALAFNARLRGKETPSCLRQMFCWRGRSWQSLSFRHGGLLTRRAAARDGGVRVVRM
jgi:hypothetical protein